MKNVSDCAGDEVVQIYVSIDLHPVPDRSWNWQPLSVFLCNRMKKKEIICHISPSQLAFLDKDMKWKIEKGDIDLLIGASSKDIRLKDSIRITENAWIDGRDRSFYGKVEVK